jgi:predicted O-methyltransferase YrrM
VGRAGSPDRGPPSAATRPDPLVKLVLVSDDPRWIDVERWITGHLIQPDPALDDAVKRAAEAGLPAIQVEPTTGKLLQLMARMVGARRILEIGTLGGYSTIWLARALPEDGLLITLEANPDYAAVAAESIRAAGVGPLVDLRVGPALDALPRIADEGGGPFDFVFIDADKQNQDAYLSWALQLTRLGSVIVGDNVVRDGRVLDASTDDPSIQGIQRFMELLESDPRVDATAIQTVGSKGYDGFAVGLVVEES